MAGGFIQLNHGKSAPLKRMRAGDGIVMYSPRTAYPEGQPLQAFTAIGTVASGEIYQFEMSPDFKPYRIDVDFRKCRETLIRPLVQSLTFIRSKTHWGAVFRFGYIKIPATDFEQIEDAMAEQE